MVTKLDRLARSLPDARAIAEELTARKVRLSLGSSVYDPNDPVGRLLFNVLAMVAEFEADLIRARTRGGMRVAQAKGHLRGKQPKLNPRQEAHLVELLRSGPVQHRRIGRLVGVARSTVYRAAQRSKTAAGVASKPRGVRSHAASATKLDDRRLPTSPAMRTGRGTLAPNRAGFAAYILQTVPRSRCGTSERNGSEIVCDLV